MKTHTLARPVPSCWIDTALWGASLEIRLRYSLVVFRLWGAANGRTLVVGRGVTRTVERLWTVRWEVLRARSSHAVRS